MTIPKKQSRKQNRQGGHLKIGISDDEPLREFADALRQATQGFPEHERLAVYHAVAAAKQLTCALLGPDAAISYATLLEALDELDDGRLPDLFRPNRKSVGFSPDGPSSWAQLQATAAACVTVLHQTTVDLRKAAYQVSEWWREAKPDHWAPGFTTLKTWRRDLQRRGPKLSAKQRETRPEEDALTDIERAKPNYHEAVIGLSQILVEEGPEALRDAARRALLDAINNCY